MVLLTIVRYIAKDELPMCTKYIILYYFVSVQTMHIP